MIVFFGTKTSPVRYDIQSPVGAGGQNVREEVLLVQYYLHEIGLATANPLIPGTQHFFIVKVDGIIGPKTLTAIQKYQSFNDITPDRRVDPQGKTIRLLNFDFRNHRRDVPFIGPASWPRIPEELAVALEKALSLSEPRPRPHHVISRF